jgi:hypothetical protein
MDESTTATPTVFLLGADADAGHAEKGPSTGGFRLLIGDVTIHAKSGKQHGRTTLATCDAELMEVSNAIALVEAHRDFLGELGFPQLQPSPIGCDNSAAVSIANKATAFKRSLYMYRRADFVLKASERGQVKVYSIASDDNVSDVLTKILSAKKFKFFRRKLLNTRHMEISASSIHLRRAKLPRMRYV